MCHCSLLWSPRISIITTKQPFKLYKLNVKVLVCNHAYKTTKWIVSEGRVNTRWHFVCAMKQQQRVPRCQLLDANNVVTSLLSFVSASVWPATTMNSCSKYSIRQRPLSAKLWGPLYLYAASYSRTFFDGNIFV